MILRVAGSGGLGPLTALALTVLPGILSAQVVEECGWRGQAATIPEPWEENTRSFANGAVRIALSDPGEPACCSASLIVLLPDPLSGRRCFVLRDRAVGWYGVEMSGVTASYDAARGLLLSVPVSYPHPLGGSDPERGRRIAVRINQSEGTVSLE